MIKFLKYLLTGILVSMYFFPFEFTVLPGLNTKMMEAALGVVFFIYYLVTLREFRIPKSIFVIIILSSLVSLIGLFSITYNQTEDYAYATYLISALVWMGGAFFLCCLIHFFHKRIDIPIVVNYLIAVCVFQCAIAMLIEYVPAVKIVVDTTINQGHEMLQSVHRLYGIGAGLDVAGCRFSIVLAAMSVLVAKESWRMNTLKIALYFLAFFIIVIIGNMIARTTLVGAGVGLAYLVLSLIFESNKETKRKSKTMWAFFMIAAIVILVSVSLYQSIPSVRDQYRFAFEGFFNYVETGEWQSSSTDRLGSMVIFPESLKTWVIGDGYFSNSRYDINYLGTATEGGFYMGTDIGYLRFLFYFGVIGLSAMVAVMAYTAFAAAKKDPYYRLIPLLTLLVGLIVWLKVATDVFLALALFLIALEMKAEIAHHAGRQCGADECEKETF